MVTAGDIMKAVNQRITFLLDVAQAALPTSQFQAFRKLTLSSFGRDGLDQDIQHLFSKERSGPE